MMFSIWRGQEDDSETRILRCEIKKNLYFLFFIKDLQPEKNSFSFQSPLLVLIIAFTFMVPLRDPAERQLSWDTFPAFLALCANLDCLPSLPCQCHQRKHSTGHPDHSEPTVLLACFARCYFVKLRSRLPCRGLHRKCPASVWVDIMSSFI